jgi:RHS repeat-associated protein
MGDFGLMFYNARWYDPAIGRFAQADTLIPSNQGVQAWDRYAYSNNNPLLYTDPSGHCITLFGISLACPPSGSLGPLIFVRVEERESAHISVALPEDATAGWIVDPPYVPLDTGALINVPTAEDDGPEGFDPLPNGNDLKVIAETIDPDDILNIEEHLSRLDHSPTNDAMIDRLKAGEWSPWDQRYAEHELIEKSIMDDLIINQGFNVSDAYDVAHPEVLEQQGLVNQAGVDAYLYHPDVIAKYPSYFNNAAKYVSQKLQSLYSK